MTTAPKVCLATCKHHPGFCANDDAPLLDAFNAAGAVAKLVEWDDRSTNWADFDAVVIRTTWDYMDRLDEFLAWADHVHAVSRLLNPPAILRANLDKTYLRDLEHHGAPIVPTRWLDPDEAGDLEAALRDTGWTDIILKPTVGAGASGLKRLDLDTQLDDALDHARELLQRGVAMAQPWLPSILDRGELSIVLVEGELSHAVRKVPSGGDFRVQIEFGGQYTLQQPTQRETEIAKLAHDRIAGDHAPLLYCRADIVEPQPGEPALIEFEAVEPELFFPMAPDAARLVAQRTLARLAAV